MKTSRIGLFATVLTLLAFAPALAQTGQDLLQQALVKEQAEGNLQEAIRLYERIVLEFAGDRPLAARALVQMGRCYEKLGSQEAERSYQRVVTDYADQREFVAQARELLAAIQQAARPEAAGVPRITTRLVHKWVYGEALPLAVTPDGQQLVYEDLWFGNLAFREIATRTIRDLIQDSSWSIWGANTSPDGQTVSYLLAEPNTSSLHVVGIDGSDPRVLYRETGCPVSHHPWTSDGRHIVAVVGCGASQPQVMRVSVTDGSAVLVRELDPGRLGNLSISPDDRYVVYDRSVESDGGNSDVWILAMDGSRNVPLVRHSANDQLLGWVPGTDEVLFLSDRDGTMDAWTVRVSAGAAVGQPRPLRRNMGHAEPMGFTRDGSLFYRIYTRWFSTAVAPFDLDDGRILEDSSVAILGSNLPATWSPDGESVVMVVEKEGPGGPGGPYKRPLRIRHLPSGEERELANHLQTRNQKWSPDGRSILVNGYDEANEDEDYHGSLYTVDVESGETTPILAVGPGTSWWQGIAAVWSPDGEAIIYSRYDEDSEQGYLVWRDIDSGRERELYRNPLLTVRLLALSPDGTRLVFGVKNSPEESAVTIANGGRLMIMDLADGTVRELHAILGPGRVSSLQWTPDGASILYGKRTEDHSTSVWRVPATGGDADELWSFEGDHFSAYFDLSPDGRRIVYTTYHQEYEVWVMENLLAGRGPGGR